MFEKRKIAFRTLAFSSLVAFMCLLGGCNAKDDADSYKLPSRLTSSLELRKKEKLRVVEYAPDEITKIRSTVTYLDGTAAEFTYRTTGQFKGAIATGKMFYAPPAGMLVGKVSRQFSISDDGQSLASDKRFRIDGSLEYSAALAGDVYESFSYRGDGTDVRVHRRFVRDDSWMIVLEEVFFPDASIAKRYHQRDDGTFETIVYSESHVVIARTVIDEKEGTAVSEQFAADGQTIVERAEENASTYTVVSYKDGVAAETREFTLGYGWGTNWQKKIPTEMRVTVHDAKGHPRFRQSFEMSNETSSDLRESSDPYSKLSSNLFLLNDVEYFNEKGQVVKTVLFQEDRKTPRSISINDNPDNESSSAQTISTYREDGTLELIEKRDDDGHVTSSEDHTEAENIRAPVDQEVLEMRPIQKFQPMLGLQKALPTDPQN